MRNYLNIMTAALFASMVLIGTAYINPVEAKGAQEGETCGTIAGIKCGKGLFCDHEPGTCSATDQAGKCVKVSAACTTDYKPVCGCDGKTYSNDCNRINAGAQKQSDGACPKPKKY